MHFSQALSVAALAAGAQAATYTVEVSNQNNILRFMPDTVTAAQGDTVEFVFNPMAHSVTEADFASPCVPLESGFNSGFHPQQAGAANQDTFTVMINDTNPHWFYCAQGRHCENGMVGVINPPASGNTLSQFNDTARAVQASRINALSQGGVNSTIPAGSANTTNNATASSSSSAAGSVVTSYSQQVLTTAIVTTDANGQPSTQVVVATTSVAIPISSVAGGVKGQLVGFGAAAAGLAAMFL